MKLIGVVGFASSGKTSGLRNLPPKETFIVSPFKEDLPLPGFSSNYSKLTKNNEGKMEGNFTLEKDVKRLPRLISMVANDLPHVKYLVIEDFTHFFNHETLSESFRNKGKGKENWSRWGDFGATIYQSLFGNLKSMRNDLWLIVHFHPESVSNVNSPTGEKLKIKTPGALLEKEVDIPSYFNWLFYTKVLEYKKGIAQADRYKYITNDDGTCEAKTSMGAFDEMYIPNDLFAAIQKIEEYTK